MSPQAKPLIGRLARVSIVVLLLAVAQSPIPSAARAGIGDLVKSAKDKAAKATGKKAAPPGGPTSNPQFDDTTVELTGDLLDKLIACRKAAATEIQDRPALAQRAAALAKEIAALNEKHADAMRENYNQRSEVGNCMDVEFQEIRDRKLQEEQARLMANPAAAERLARLSLGIQEALAKGDTAEVNRLKKQADAMFAPTPADSLEVRKKCGPMPPLHPARVRIDALEKELAETDRKLREMERKFLAIQVQKCGMTDVQIAMAWERVELYLGAARNSNPGGFSAVELEALGERKSALETALKA